MKCLVCEELFEVSSKQSQRKYCSNRCGNIARGRRWYKNNPEKVLLKRKTESLDWSKRACSRLRYTAKIRGIPFNIEPQDLVIPEKCPVLGVPIERSIGIGSGYWNNNPSVDKIKPELGYVKGNVRVISHRANLLKSDASVEELELVLKDLKNIYDI